MTKVTKLLSLLLVVCSYWAFQQLSPNVENSLLSTSVRSEANQHDLTDITASPFKKEPIDHAYQSIDYKPPVSEWLSQDKQRYQQLLSNEKFDVLVVPFQVNGYAFDRATRSLMTALLTSELSKKSDLKLPDPYILARALGDGQRHYDSNEVIAYARKLGVKNIIWGYVGHDLQNNFSVNIQLLDNRSLPTFNESSPKGKIYKSVNSFDDKTPAIEVFQKLIPEILEAFKIPLIKTAEKDNSEFDLELTEDLTELFSQKYSSVSNAYIYQTLAYLTPSYAERTKERFIEKSFLALSEVSPSVPEYRALKARAYKGLGMRPSLHLF